MGIASMLRGVWRNFSRETLNEEELKSLLEELEIEDAIPSVPKEFIGREAEGSVYSEQVDNGTFYDIKISRDMKLSEGNYRRSLEEVSSEQGNLEDSSQNNTSPLLFSDVYSGRDIVNNFTSPTNQYFPEKNRVKKVVPNPDTVSGSWYKEGQEFFAFVEENFLWEGQGPRNDLTVDDCKDKHRASIAYQDSITGILLMRNEVEVEQDFNTGDRNYPKFENEILINTKTYEQPKLRFE